MALAQTDPAIGVLANKATLLRGILTKLNFEEKEPFKMTMQKYEEDLYMKGLGLFYRELEVIKNAPEEVPVVEEVNKLEVLNILLESWVKMYSKDEESAKAAEVCLSTIGIYVTNRKNIPLKAGFEKRVGSVAGGKEILRAFDFEEIKGELVLQRYDFELHEEGKKMLLKHI